MKTNLLTQIELATLASHLPSGTAKERVQLAFEIWMESNPNRAEVAYMEKRITELSAPQHSAMLPFETALDQLFPDLAKAKREGEFFQFREWQKAQGIETLTAEHEKMIGVKFSPDIYDEIRRWKDHESSEKRSAKARTAAKKRWADQPPKPRKAGGKTQQTRKKSKT